MFHAIPMFVELALPAPTVIKLVQALFFKDNQPLVVSGVKLSSPMFQTLVIFHSDKSSHAKVGLSAVPSHSVVLCALASASSSRARHAAVQVISSTSHAPAVLLPSSLSVADTFCILA